MSDRGVLIFAYDGSFEGFLSLVFDSFSMKTVPADIVIFDDAEPSLLKMHRAYARRMCQRLRGV